MLKNRLKYLFREAEKLRQHKEDGSSTGVKVFNTLDVADVVVKYLDEEGIKKSNEFEWSFEKGEMDKIKKIRDEKRELRFLSSLLKTLLKIATNNSADYGESNYAGLGFFNEFDRVLLRPEEQKFKDAWGKTDEHPVPVQDYLGFTRSNPFDPLVSKRFEKIRSEMVSAHMNVKAERERWYREKELLENAVDVYGSYQDLIGTFSAINEMLDLNRDHKKDPAGFIKAVQKEMDILKADGVSLAKKYYDVQEQTKSAREKLAKAKEKINKQEREIRILKKILVNQGTLSAAAVKNLTYHIDEALTIEERIDRAKNNWRKKDVKSKPRSTPSPNETYHGVSERI